MRAPEKNNNYHNKRLLVTGASGFLATNLIKELSGVMCYIRRLSRCSSPFMPVSGSAVIEDMTGDITGEEIWQSALEDIDIVFHFAAQTSVSAANDDPVTDFAANVLPLLHLLETCRRKRLHPVVLFAGTVTEAGVTSGFPVDETHSDNPVTVYDLHKLMAETYLKYYVRQGMVRGAALRLANVYGPGPASSGADRGILNRMIKKAISGEALTIYGHGNYMRDYVFVNDVVDAFLYAGADIDRLNGRHYIIGSGEGHTVAEAVHLIAKCVEEKCGRAVPVEYVDPPEALSPIEERNFVADTKNFSSATDWTARASLAEGIDLTIDYFSGIMKEVS